LGEAAAEDLAFRLAIETGEGWSGRAGRLPRITRR